MFPAGHKLTRKTELQGERQGIPLRGQLRAAACLPLAGLGRRRNTSVHV